MSGEVAPINEQRAIRAENYAIKRAAGFRCEGGEVEDGNRCTATDQLLACDLVGAAASEDCKTLVLCPRHVEEADGRRVKVRPHQWDEAERAQEALRRRG